MSTATTVWEQIDEGRRLLDRLEQSGFGISSAAWLHFSDDGLWLLYIVSTDADADRSAAAKQKVAREMSGLTTFSISEVKLLGVKDPIGKSLSNGFQGRSLRSQVLDSIKLAGLAVDDCYIYPPSSRSHTFLSDEQKQLLISIYNEIRPLGVDDLPYTDEMESIHREFTERSDSGLALTTRDLFKALKNLGRQGTLGRRTLKEFLSNFRVARNLFVHDRAMAEGDSSHKSMPGGNYTQSAIWLTPKSVQGFNREFFGDLGFDRQMELETNVMKFRTLAESVHANAMTNNELLHQAEEVFVKILEILEPYILITDEERKVEKVLGEVSKKFFLDWVLNWDYELGTDSDGGPALWVNLYIDQSNAVSGQLGRSAAEWNSKVRKALVDAGVDRWPYLRIRTSAEHRAWS